MKRRRLNNTNGKENTALNNPPLVSVAERIAELLKPGENYRKRKVEAEQYDVDDDMSLMPSPAKRLKGRMKPKQTKTVADRDAWRPFSSPRWAIFSKNESPEERRWVERQFPPTFPFPSMRTADGLCHRQISGSEPELSSQPGTTPTTILTQGCDSVPGPKIDLRVARRTIKRIASTPETLLNIISNQKRKRDVGDEGVSEHRQYSGILSRPLTRFTPRRTQSLPSQRGRLDSDSTLVNPSDDDLHSEWVKLGPPKKEASYKKLALDVASVGDDPLLGSDDTAASGSSSEEDSPTKEVVNRRMQRMGSSVETF